MNLLFPALKHVPIKEICVIHMNCMASVSIEPLVSAPVLIVYSLQVKLQYEIDTSPFVVLVILTSAQLWLANASLSYSPVHSCGWGGTSLQQSL